MKKLFLLLISFPFFFISCTEKPSIDYAIITGRIANPNTSKLLIMSSYNERENKLLTLNEAGIFTDTITIENNRRFLLRDKKNTTELHLAKGSTTTINYDAEDYSNSIEIEGNNKEIHNYLLNKDKKIRIPNFYSLYKGEKSVFMDTLVKYKQARHKFLSENKSELPKDYFSLEEKDIEYEAIVEMFHYERTSAYYNTTKSVPFEFSPSNEFYEKLKNISFTNQEDYLHSSSYRFLIGFYHNEKVEKTIDSTMSREVAMLDAFSKIENNIIRDHELFEEANYKMEFRVRSIDKDIDNYYQAFLDLSTNKKNNEFITKKYNNYKKQYNDYKRLLKGEKSPIFNNYKNYKGKTTSIEDLKGKYTYIDVWATWCKPCIKEVPSLKKLEKQYHKKNIQFVSISIDDKKDFEKWKNMIKKKKLGGIQLFADNNWNSQFIKDYMIKSIPRFILLDPEGKIVDANAPRPSDDKLVNLLNSLEI